MKIYWLLVPLQFLWKKKKKPLLDTIWNVNNKYNQTSDICFIINIFTIFI